MEEQPTIEQPKPIVGTFPYTFEALPGVTLIVPAGLSIGETLHVAAQVSYQIGLHMANQAADNARVQALSMVSVETQGYEQRAAQEEAEDAGK